MAQTLPNNSNSRNSSARIFFVPICLAVLYLTYRLEVIPYFAILKKNVDSLDDCSRYYAHATLGLLSFGAFAITAGKLDTFINGVIKIIKLFGFNQEPYADVQQSELFLFNIVCITMVCVVVLAVIHAKVCPTAQIQYLNYTPLLY